MLVIAIIFFNGVASEKEFVKEQFQKKKIVCSQVHLKVATVVNVQECVHRCLHLEECSILNFKEKSDHGKEDCEVYNVSLQLQNNR